MVPVSFLEVAELPLDRKTQMLTNVIVYNTLCKMPHPNTRSGRLKICNYSLIDSFSRRYLQTYYTKIDQDEFEIAKFLVKEYKKVKGHPRMLEIGCGPTVHHLFPAVPYVSAIDIADYLKENLEQVRLWKDKQENAHEWNSFTRNVLEFEGKKPSIKDIESREDKLRKLISNFHFCNVLRDNPLPCRKKYSMIGFYYCAEEVAIDIGEWGKIMKRASNILLPKGQMFLVALWATDHYVINHANGCEKLPTAYITKNLMQSTLFKLGFNMKKTTVKVVRTPTQVHQGIKGVILVSAKKL